MLTRMYNSHLEYWQSSSQYGVEVDVHGRMLYCQAHAPGSTLICGEHHERYSQVGACQMKPMMAQMRVRDLAYGGEFVTARVG